MTQLFLSNAVQQLIQQHPEKRVLPLTIDGKKYYIKRRMSNGRNRFAKTNSSTAFWCELYKIMVVRQYASFVPNIVLLSEDYVVMDAAGKTLQGVAKEKPWLQVRDHAFEEAGRSLALLHKAGLHHGRPALRDIAYDMDTDAITLLDWENEKTFVSMDTKALDIFLFIHSCFREKWAAKDRHLIDAAWKGYISVPESTAQLDSIRQFIHIHRHLFHLIHSLCRFHWKDVTAVDRTRAYFDSLTSETDYLPPRRDGDTDLPAAPSGREHA